MNDLNGNEILKYQRQSQIVQRRKVYQWQAYPEINLPSSINDDVKDLPINEQFEAVKSYDFTRNAFSSVAQTGLNTIFGGAINGRSLSRYERLATAIATPAFTPLELYRWVSDEEFGRQMLNAVNPVVIERCSSIPANFPVTNDMVKGSLVRGVSLDDEMKVIVTKTTYSIAYCLFTCHLKNGTEWIILPNCMHALSNSKDAYIIEEKKTLRFENQLYFLLSPSPPPLPNLTKCCFQAGHVYICDLTILEGLKTREGWYCPAPLCLLYVNKNNNLVPIAIQLKQTPGSDNPIFLPSDHWADWTLAKICYQSAHNQVHRCYCTGVIVYSSVFHVLQFHQLISHYFSCHAAMEAYAMATMRNLPDAHPVQKLLRPHFLNTMAINARARATLINTGGIIDLIFAIGGEGKNELMKRGGARYNIHWTNIKQSIKKRGVDDPNLLPGYYYRDDGLKIWNAIEEFVREIINEFYTSDDDVGNDTELQSWAQDLYTNAFPQDYNKNGNGVPSKIENKAQLVELCTLIMFTGSSQHAAVNFGQYETYGFVPNAPSTICYPLPTSKGKADLQTVLDALPNTKNARVLLPGTNIPSSAAPLEVAVVYQLSQFSSDEVCCAHSLNVIIRILHSFPFRSTLVTTHSRGSQKKRLRI